MKFLKKNWLLLGITLIFFNLILSTYWLINSDIQYNIDTSRDFLIISEIIESGKLTLIGPRSGIIGGLFHGPAWYYLNLPAFFLTGSNPILMGWFWFLLSILTLIIFWIITQKLFNKQTAVLATLLYSANSIINPNVWLKQFFNPYGAVVLSPVFFYLFVRYIQTKKVLYLAFTFLTLGFIIQFQIAFGMPVLILLTIFLIYFLSKNHLLKHLFVYLILLIPLSTFIIFDLKHDFLQTKSFLSFIQNYNFAAGSSILNTLPLKLESVFTDTYFLLTQDNRILAFIYSLLFIVLVIKTKIPQKKFIYFLFLYFYFGFWIMFFPFKESIGTYHWPFLPIIIILISAFYNYLPKKIFFIIYIPLLLWNLYIGFVYINNFELNPEKRGINSWAYNKLLAEEVYQSADNKFGYFIFTPDRWTYNQWYALDYVQKFYPNKIATPFIKQKQTFLLVVDRPEGRFDIDPNGWKITDLKITSQPVEIKKINVTQIEKYNLIDEEINNPTNPYLLNSTFFR